MTCSISYYYMQKHMRRCIYDYLELSSVILGYLSEIYTSEEDISWYNRKQSGMNRHNRG